MYTPTQKSGSAQLLNLSHGEGQVNYKWKVIQHSLMHEVGLRNKSRVYLIIVNDLFGFRSNGGG